MGLCFRLMDLESSDNKSNCEMTPFKRWFIFKLRISRVFYAHQNVLYCFFYKYFIDFHRYNLINFQTPCFDENLSVKENINYYSINQLI